MKQVFAAFTLAFLLQPLNTFAQPTVAFGARVTFVSGVDAAKFAAGDLISISYSLNVNTPDNNNDPQAGVFFGATDSLSVSFATRGFFATGTSGNVQTFDNFDSGGGTTSDQVFFFGGPIASSSSLGGAAINGVEVDFLSAFLPAPDEPTMLLSDAIPAFIPASNQSFVILTTSNGSTFVNFEVVGSTVQLTANGSHGSVTLAPGAALNIEGQFDAPGTGLANANVFIGVSAPFGLFWVGPSGFTPAFVAVHSGPLADFGPTTLLPFPSTAGFPSGTYKWFMFVQDTATGEVSADFVQTIIP